MLNIADHQGNANQTLDEMPPRICQNGSSTQKREQVLMRMGRRATLVPCWWEGKVVQPLEKTVGRFLKTLQTDLPHALAVPLPGTQSHRKQNRQHEDRSALPRSGQRASLTGAKLGKQAQCPTTNEGRKCVGIYTYNGILFSLKSSHCDNINESRGGGHYAK